VHRRTLLATAASAVASVATAGCLTDDEPGASTTERSTVPDDERTDATSVRPETTGPSTPTETTDDDSNWVSELESEPDPSKLIRLGNDGEDGVEHDLAIEIYHEATGKVVHDRTHTVAAGETITAYDTADANPTGIDTFRATCEFESDSKQVRIETNECYGWAEFVVSAEDELRGSYTIC
jgi:hypothetical protein